jgi:hypothetical protein
MGCMPWHGPDGHRLYYEYTGRGDTVVLMAGWAGNIIELSRLRAALSAGFRVIAVGQAAAGPAPVPVHLGRRREDRGHAG